MDNTTLNFAMISKALSCSLEALQCEESLSASSALKDLQEAKKQLQQGLLFSPPVKI